MPVLSGQVANGRVRDALSTVWGLLEGNCVAIVRSIDSTRSREALKRILDYHDIVYRLSGGNICIDMKSLFEALRSGLFAGFDEVWLVPENKSSIKLDDVPSITSEVTDLSKQVNRTLLEAIEQSHAALVLGDGCGLNYATDDSRIVRALDPTMGY